MEYTKYTEDFVKDLFKDGTAFNAETEETTEQAQEQTTTQTQESTTTDVTATNNNTEITTASTTEDVNNDNSSTEEVDEFEQWAESLKTPSSVATEVTNTETTTTTESTVSKEELEKVKKVEELLADPFISWALSVKEQGRDVASELKNLVPVDVDKLTPENLYEAQIREAANDLGLSGEELEEQVSNELENFRNLSILEKSRLTKDYKDKLKAEQGRKMEFLKPDTSKVEAETKRLNEIANKAHSRKKELIETQSEYLGLELTQERKKAIENFLDTKAPLVIGDDGFVNVDEMYEFGMWKLFKSDLIKTIGNKARNSGKREVIVSRTNPNPNDSPSYNANSSQKADPLDDVISKIGKKDLYLNNK